MESAAGAERSTWQDYASYARNIQRLCNIALLGESHIYQLTTEDIGAGQKLWNLLKYKMTGEDMLTQNASGTTSAWNSCKPCTTAPRITWTPSTPIMTSS